MIGEKYLTDVYINNEERDIFHIKCRDTKGKIFFSSVLFKIIPYLA